ncbi:hypothetical protein [Arenimonas caeni]|uniref:Uncharacterized protein n=1 Tax=Arenimonas caeni TaxID=2058085 RepID=A0A2P6M9G1_9GAMM|nr:hypothetical protein [Arenimonas caeni]PRH82612.1 hypothetical protein C6N40_06465 [Arenimonas caeni]
MSITILAALAIASLALILNLITTYRLWRDSQLPLGAAGTLTCLTQDQFFHKIYPAKQPPEAVVIIAPAGAGKTRNQAALKKMFGCTSIVDEWDGRSPLPPGALALTNASIRQLAHNMDKSAPARSRA